MLHIWTWLRSHKIEALQGAASGEVQMTQNGAKERKFRSACLRLGLPLILEAAFGGEYSTNIVAKDRTAAVCRF